MIDEFITKKSERCGIEIKVSEEYFENEGMFQLCQVECPNGCKIHTFNSNRMKWLRELRHFYSAYTVPISPSAAFATLATLF